ncbi:MAG: PIG-L family deacetylase [Acidobacteria bacterium]|nr:PIG-L family deacetylase [Acidobacteriota bacterium]
MTYSKCLHLVVVLLLVRGVRAAEIFVPDERLKSDILVVVAHPDDETLVSSYLARESFDQHKHIAVVYCTRGDSGANSTGREHARALGLVREMEGRRALSLLGITKVWFLDGRDTSSQNVLVSLASWPAASVVEQTVRILRLTRPEIVLTWLPASVAGENHGDHQAAGVIATEAFDLAGDPAAFAWQLAAPIRQYENALEGLRPWQAKKLYYFSDAFDTGFFRGHGPEYSGEQISPERHRAYLALATAAAAPYLTQSPDPTLNRRIDAGEDLDSITAKLQQAGYFPEPVRLWLGKSLVSGAVTADVWDGIDAAPIPFTPPQRSPPEVARNLEFSLGGPWGFYQQFWRAHELGSLRFRRAEIAVRPGDTLTIPVVIRNPQARGANLTVSASLPERWRQKSESLSVKVPEDGEMTVAVPVIAPTEQSQDFAEIRITAASGGDRLFQGSVFVLVNPFVAEQLKW